MVSNGKVSTEGSGFHRLFKGFLEADISELPMPMRSVSVDENGNILFRAGLGRFSPSVVARLDFVEIIKALNDQINEGTAERGLELGADL